MFLVTILAMTKEKHMSFLTGKKTYITGGLMILMGIAGLTGLLPGVNLGDPVQMISAGFGLIFLRNGVANS